MGITENAPAIWRAPLILQFVTAARAPWDGWACIFHESVVAQKDAHHDFQMPAGYVMRWRAAHQLALKLRYM